MCVPKHIAHPHTINHPNFISRLGPHKDTRLTVHRTTYMTLLYYTYLTCASSLPIISRTAQPDLFYICHRYPRGSRGQTTWLNGCCWLLPMIYIYSERGPKKSPSSHLTNPQNPHKRGVNNTIKRKSAGNQRIACVRFGLIWFGTIAVWLIIIISMGIEKIGKICNK